jgi:hypothetical protein
MKNSIISKYSKELKLNTDNRVRPDNKRKQNRKKCKYRKHKRQKRADSRKEKIEKRTYFEIFRCAIMLYLFTVNSIRPFIFRNMSGLRTLTPTAPMVTLYSTLLSVFNFNSLEYFDIILFFIELSWSY